MGVAVDEELARLRARAYGPDADIHTDPPALARLRELEQRANEQRGSVPQWSSAQREGAGSAASDTHPDGIELAFGDLPSAGAPAGVDATAAEDAGDASGRDQPVAGVPLVAPSFPTGSSSGAVLGRRVRTAWAVSLVAAVAAGAALTAWMLPGGALAGHDARLQSQSAEIPRGIVAQFDAFEAGDDPGADEVRYFGEYRGVGVYASDRCLQAVAGRAQRTVAVTCTPGLDLVMDIYVPSEADREQPGGYSPSFPDELTQRFPGGGIVRFSLIGDEVLVDEGRVPEMP
jgi:hypothetical protein